MRCRPAPDHPWRRFRLFGKEVKRLSIPIKQMAVERAMNMVKAFGWELVKQEMGEKDVQLTIRLKFSPETVAAAGGGPGTSPG
jgi:hypothetical protein